jgi:hypothetical protein
MVWEPPAPATYDHPVRLTSTDDLERSRLTVFFRLLLAIPHLIWLVLWGLVAFFVALANWFATLFGRQSPDSLHEFLSRFVRYEIHVTAYVSLTANPFPPFLGKPGSYPIDVEFDPPAPQNRWKTGFRLILAIPAFLMGGALTGGSGSGGGRAGYGANVGVLWAGAFLGWWAALFTGRMPRQLRDASLYALRYGAQTGGYVLLLTDRYPDADPEVPPTPESLPSHPIGMSVSDELRRSRLTVFFRLLLAIPHFIWITLWGIAAFFVAIIAWFATLFTGRNPDALHRFLARFVRYGIHVYAYATLIGNPFPGFVGAPGSYPIDLRIDPPERQNRWKTGFRVFLALPAALLSGAIGSIILVSALLGWFTGLFVARMPRDLRQAGAYALRYSAQLNAYALLLTDRYPDATPRISE